MPSKQREAQRQDETRLVTQKEWRRAVMLGLRCRDDASGLDGYLYNHEFYVAVKEET